jgi:hypothetical protein
MIEAGLYSVDVWVDFENKDESGYLLADPTDAPDPALLAPGRVVAAFDDDHVALACVVGHAKRGSQTFARLALAPGDIDEYVTAVVRAVSDPCEE